MIDESAVRHAVCRFVDEMKEQEWTVERIVTELRRIAEVRNDTLHTLPQDLVAQRSFETLVRRAISWCVDHYFWTA